MKRTIESSIPGDDQDKCSEEETSSLSQTAMILLITVSYPDMEPALRTKDSLPVNAYARLALAKRKLPYEGIANVNHSEDISLNPELFPSLIPFGLDPLDLLCVSLTCREYAMQILPRARSAVTKWLCHLHDCNHLFPPRVSQETDDVINATEAPTPKVIEKDPQCVKHFTRFQLMRLLYTGRVSAPDILDARSWHSLWPVFVELCELTGQPLDKPACIRKEFNLGCMEMWPLLLPPKKNIEILLQDSGSSVRNMLASYRLMRDIHAYLRRRIYRVLSSIGNLPDHPDDNGKPWSKRDEHTILRAVFMDELPFGYIENSQPIFRAVGFALYTIFRSLSPKHRPRLDLLLRLVGSHVGNNELAYSYIDPFTSSMGMWSTRVASVFEFVLYALADVYSGRAEFTHPASLTKPGAGGNCDVKRSYSVARYVFAHCYSSHLLRAFGHKRCRPALQVFLDATMDYSFHKNPLFSPGQTTWYTSGRHRIPLLAMYQLPAHPFWIKHPGWVLAMRDTIKLKDTYGNAYRRLVNRTKPNTIIHDGIALVDTLCADPFHFLCLLFDHYSDRQFLDLLAVIREFTSHPNVISIGWESVAVFFLIYAKHQRTSVIHEWVKQWILFQWPPNVIALHLLDGKWGDNDTNPTILFWEDGAASIAFYFTDDVEWMRKVLAYLYSSKEAVPVLPVILNDLHSYFPGLHSIMITKHKDDSLGLPVTIPSVEKWLDNAAIQSVRDLDAMHEQYRKWGIRGIGWVKGGLTSWWISSVMDELSDLAPFDSKLEKRLCDPKLLHALCQRFFRISTLSKWMSYFDVSPQQLQEKSVEVSEERRSHFITDFDSWEMPSKYDKDSSDFYMACTLAIDNKETSLINVLRDLYARAMLCETRVIMKEAKKFTRRRKNSNFSLNFISSHTIFEQMSDYMRASDVWRENRYYFKARFWGAEGLDAELPTLHPLCIKFGLAEHQIKLVEERTAYVQKVNNKAVKRKVEEEARNRKWREEHEQRQNEKKKRKK